MCLQIFVLDQYGDHVLTCKKHTGTIAGHGHVMNVTAQLARNSGLKVGVNRKVDTTAVDNNKQGDCSKCSSVMGLTKLAPGTGLRVTPMILPRNSLAVGWVTTCTVVSPQ